MVELTFWEERFDVKLLTLESSRLNGQKSLGPEVRVITGNPLIMIPEIRIPFNESTPKSDPSQIHKCPHIYISEVPMDIVLLAPLHRSMVYSQSSVLATKT